MWLLDLSEPALNHQGTVPCFSMYITCVAATGLHAFDRFLLVIWKSGRTCCASVTVVTGVVFGQAISACACLKTFGTYLLIYSALVIIHVFCML